MHPSRMAIGTRQRGRGGMKLFQKDGIGGPLFGFGCVLSVAMGIAGLAWYSRDAAQAESILEITFVPAVAVFPVLAVCTPLLYFWTFMTGMPAVIVANNVNALWRNWRSIVGIALICG